MVLASKRIANIAQGRAGASRSTSRSASSPAERDLAAAFQGAARRGRGGRGEPATTSAACAAIADLAPVLDRFFVEVLVMDPDPRCVSNRLAPAPAIHRTLAERHG